MLLIIKHWIFSMKHWTLSNTLKEVLTQQKPSACSRHGAVIYAILLTASAIVPLIMCICFYLQDVAAAKWFYRLWVAMFFASIVFLIDAYYRITANLQAQQNVRKALMLWQAISSLVMCGFYLFSVQKMEF